MAYIAFIFIRDPYVIPQYLIRCSLLSDHVYQIALVQIGIAFYRTVRKPGPPSYIDAVSGATLTSNRIMDAVADCLRQAAK